MSKKNYNKISTERAKAVEEVVEEAVLEAVEEEVVENVVKETPVKKPVIGVVVGCSKLNIRKEPSLNADILLTVDAGEQLIIHETVGDFYKVGNPEIGEYCMKKFISIKE